MITTDDTTWRIGNQLYVAACAIAYGKRNGHQVKFPEKFALLNTFLKTPVEIIYPNQESYTALKESGIAYTPLQDIKALNVIIEGYRQSWKYWWEDRKTIFEAFSFKSEIVTACKERIKTLQGFGKELVAVHFRFTDYLTSKEYHTCLTETDYYENAIQKFDIGKVMFVVFSDDKKMAFQAMSKLREKFGITYVVMENTTDHEDLLLMSYCLNHICSNSSFSAWGAMLCPDPNMITMPKEWFGPAYTSIGWNADDIYLPAAIVL